MAGKILFIIIDQLRADCLNGALAGSVEMPNLRALMKEGVTFNSHYSVTVPCGPARASIMTGLYAMNHRSVNNGTPLAANHPTIATEIRKAGYDPLLFGYTDASIDPALCHPNDPLLREEEGIAPGFSEIVRMRFNSNYSWLADLKDKGYKLPKNYWGLFEPVSAIPGTPPAINDPAIYSSEDSDTAFLTNQTLRELSVRQEMDWFSTVAYIRPHPPLVAPAPYNDMYAPDAGQKPQTPLSIDEMKALHPVYKTFFEKHFPGVIHFGFDGNVSKMSDEIVALLRGVYFGLITELDLHIGRLINFLRETEQLNDTLVVVTADHGEMLGDHHMWGKNTPQNGSYHVPLIIRDPRRMECAGREVSAFTESIDIAPTLLDWVGLPPAPGFNGKSLLPWCEGKTPENWRTHMFAEMDMSDRNYCSVYQKEFGTEPHETGFAILQDQQFKLVHFNGGISPLLYDMKNDPQESNNLAKDPAYIADLLAMTQKMLDHRMTHAHHALSRMKLTPTGLEDA